jgi:hypothetical protein
MLYIPLGITCIQKKIGPIILSVLPQCIPVLKSCSGTSCTGPELCKSSSSCSVDLPPNQVRFNFTIMNRLKDPITKVHSVGSCGCKSYTNDFTFMSSVAVQADDFEILVSCARCVKNF